MWRELEAELEAEAGLERMLRPRQSSPGESEIFGTDDRRLVPNTLLAPYRFICCLEITFVNPLNGQTLLDRGTGTLISDRHVLTAAHCVMEDFSSRNAELATFGLSPFPVRYLRAQSILVAPARNDRVLPFGFSDVSNVRVAPGWQAAANRQAAAGNTSHVFADAQADFALLTLATPLGEQELLAAMAPAPLLGYWGHPLLSQGTRIRPIELNRLRNQPVNTAGYAADKCRARPLFRPADADEIAACQGTIPGEPEFHDRGSTQWVTTDRVVNPAPADMPGMITYMADMDTGQSGSPVWLRWRDFRNLVAINTGGYVRPTPPHDVIANMGVRITEPVLRLLRGWMRADNVQPRF